MKHITLPYVESLTLLFGVLGFLVSLVLLTSLDLMKIISNFFNKQVDVDRKFKFLNTYVRADFLFSRYPLYSGIVLSAASLFVLYFLCFRLDLLVLIHKMRVPEKLQMFVTCLLHSMTLFTKLTAGVGLLSGVLLIFCPSFFKKIESKVDYWIMTEPLEEKLNEIHKDTDTICFLHSLLIGILGVISSMFLIILSISNLLHY